MKILACVVSVVALLVFPGSSARAQTGTAALSLPINPRTVAMGYAGAAENGDPSAVFLNPANVIAAPHAYLIGSMQRFSFDEVVDGGDAPDVQARRGDGGGSWKFNDASAWTFGASLAYAAVDWDYEFAEISGVSETMLSLAAGAGLATGNGFEFRFGAAIKRVSASVLDIGPSFELTTADIDGYAYDAGIAAALRGDETQWNVTPQFGVAFVNGGSDLQHPDGSSQPLPTAYNVGASVRVASPMDSVGSAEVPLFAGTLNLDGQNPEDGDLYWAIGSEMAFAQVFFLRGGIQIFDSEDDVLSWGFGIGLPLESFRFRFDYANPDALFVKDNMSLFAEWVF